MAMLQVADVTKVAPFTGPTDVRFRGLLITQSPALARAFRRELRDCSDCSSVFDVHPSLDAALADDVAYRWVAVDLDATVAPSEAVRRARTTWPRARLAAISCWWSERDAIARDCADLLLHKPVRSAELLGFLRAAAGTSDVPPSRAM